jgi:hypothetical protein
MQQKKGKTSPHAAAAGMFFDAVFVAGLPLGASSLIFSVEAAAGLGVCTRGGGGGGFLVKAVGAAASENLFLGATADVLGSTLSRPEIPIARASFACE